MELHVTQQPMEVKLDLAQMRVLLTVKWVSGGLGQVALILALHVMAQATKQEHGLPTCMRPMVELIVLNLLWKIRPAILIVRLTVPGVHGLLGDPALRAAMEALKAATATGQLRDQMVEQYAQREMIPSSRHATLMPALPRATNSSRPRGPH